MLKTAHLKTIPFTSCSKSPFYDDYPISNFVPSYSTKNSKQSMIIYGEEIFSIFMRLLVNCKTIWVRIKYELPFCLLRLICFFYLLVFVNAMIFPLISEINRENKPDKKILFGFAINLDIIKLQFVSILWWREEWVLFFYLNESFCMHAIRLNPPYLKSPSRHSRAADSFTSL